MHQIRENALGVFTDTQKIKEEGEFDLQQVLLI